MGHWPLIFAYLPLHCRLEQSEPGVINVVMDKGFSSVQPHINGSGENITVITTLSIANKVKKQSILSEIIFSVFLFWT